MSSEPQPFTLDRWLAGECELCGDASRAGLTPAQLAALCELAFAVLWRINPEKMTALGLPAQPAAPPPMARPRRSTPRGEGLTRPVAPDLHEGKPQSDPLAGRRD